MIVQWCFYNHIQASKANNTKVLYIGCQWNSGNAWNVTHRPLFCFCFRWLVGISYRVTFRRDPIPAQSTAMAPNVLKHVHGAVYICGEGIRPGCQPKGSLAKADLGDHSAQAYLGALNTNCKRQADRESSTGTNPPVRQAAICWLTLASLRFHITS